MILLSNHIFCFGQEMRKFLCPYEGDGDILFLVWIPLAFRTLVKSAYKKKKSYFATKTYVVGTQKEPSQ